MNEYDELRPHEFEGAFDPNHPMSAAMWRLYYTVTAICEEFDLTEVTYQKRVDIALAQWREVRGVWDEPDPQDDDRLPYNAPPVKQPHFAAAWAYLKTSEALAAGFRRQSLLGLVAAFDTFLGELVRAAFKLRPELLQCSEREFTWADVSHLGGLDAVQGLVVEREVDRLLHEGRSDQMKLLAKRLNLGELKLDERSELSELFERRNLAAHTGGRVTAQYRKVCPKLAQAPPVGSYLDVDSAYFQSAGELIVTVAVKLTQLAWRAVGGADQIGAADRDLAQLTYVLLMREQWAFAQRMLKFARGLDHSSEPHKVVFTVNYAQTFKWLNNQPACVGVLRTVDFRGKDLALRLSDVVLRDDFAAAARLMVDAANARQVQRSAFDHWPVYRTFRLSPEYRAAYRDLYGADPPVR